MSTLAFRLGRSPHRLLDDLLLRSGTIARVDPHVIACQITRPRNRFRISIMEIQGDDDMILCQDGFAHLHRKEEPYPEPPPVHRRGRYRLCQVKIGSRVACRTENPASWRHVREWQS